MKDILLVFLGGGLGSVGRYGISLLLKPFAASCHGLPIHTLAANLIGSLAIGLLIGCLGKHPDQALSLLLVTGFCGGFTTFSTFSSENVALLRDGQPLMALTYMAITIIVCLAATALGATITSR